MKKAGRSPLFRNRRGGYLVVDEDPLLLGLELDGLLLEPLALEGLELDGVELELLPAPEPMLPEEPELEPEEPLFSLFSCFSHSE